MTDVGTTPRKPMSPMRRLRIFEAHGGICILCGLKIHGGRGEKWIVEHKRALVLGGEDTDANCGPAHETCRRVKDKADIASASKAKRMKAKHLGIKRASSFPKMPEGYRYDWRTRRPIKIGGGVVRRDA